MNAPVFFRNAGRAVLPMFARRSLLHRNDPSWIAIFAIYFLNGCVDEQVSAFCAR
jgi:hypothetical protein